MRALFAPKIIITLAIVAIAFSSLMTFPTATAWQGTPVINEYAVEGFGPAGYEITGTVTGCTPLENTIVKFGGPLDGVEVYVIPNSGEFFYFTGPLDAGQEVPAVAECDGVQSAEVTASL